jgi:hypothetical protein
MVKPSMMPVGWPRVSIENQARGERPELSRLALLGGAAHAELWQ